MNIFVYRPGAIGDTVLTLPALAALRIRFPGCEITYAGNSSMLPLLPVEHALSADDPGLLPLFGEPAQPWPEADMHIIFARQPVGLDGIQRDPLEAVQRGLHVADWLVEAIQPSFTERMPRLAIRPLTSASIVMHLGAGSPAKHWPMERFVELAAKLDGPLAVVQGPADPEPAIDADYELWRDLPLAGLARRLAGCRLFVGNDSGISHLAAAVGAPAVAIYIATDPRIWGIRGAHARQVTGQASAAAVAAVCEELLESSAP